MSEPVAERGTIYDLGYKRYVGTRRPQSTRWRVILRNQIATGWKTWWRYKAWLVAAVINTMVAATFIFAMSDKTFHFGRGGFGKGISRMITTRFADAALPFAFGFFIKIAFIISVTIGASIIAGDLQSGAFTFYFARSTRPRDYVLGKLTGYGALIALPVMGGAFVIACMRVGFAGYDNASELASQLVLLPTTLAVAGLVTLVFTAVPLGFSALVPNRRNALGLWAAYYLIGGTIAAGIGMVSGSWIGALDLASALNSVAFEWFDMPEGSHVVPLTPALISIGVHVVAAIAVIWLKIASAEKAGVGGAS
jgi:hypothetical protein